MCQSDSSDSIITFVFLLRTSLCKTQPSVYNLVLLDKASSSPYFTPSARFPLSLLLSFFVAYVLFHITKGRALLRVLFFLPYITSQVAAAIVFKWIFHPNVGLANWAVRYMGGTPQQWLTDPDPVLIKLIQSLGGHWPSSIPTAFAGPTWALGVIMLFTIWGSLGFQIIVFLSGLTQIPHDLTESARIDGARTWHTIRHITLPLLSPTWFYSSLYR